MCKLSLVIGIALLGPVAAHAQMYGCGGNGSAAPGVLFLVSTATGTQTEIDDVVSLLLPPAAGPLGICHSVPTRTLTGNAA